MEEAEVLVGTEVNKEPLARLMETLPQEEVVVVVMGQVSILVGMVVLEEVQGQLGPEVLVLLAHPYKAIGAVIHPVELVLAVVVEWLKEKMLVVGVLMMVVMVVMGLTGNH